MHSDFVSTERDENEKGVFQPTNWTWVAMARQPDSIMGEKALGHLFRQYQKPLEIFLKAKFPHYQDREDAIQDTFRLLIARKGFSNINHENGRFRDYLKKCAVNVVMENLRASGTVKRMMPAAEDVRWDANAEDADLIYDRAWAKATVVAVMAKLEEECSQGGKNDFFVAAKKWIIVEPAAGEYEEGSRKLGLKPNTLRQMVIRMRRRFRDVLREQVAITVAGEDVDEEMKHLLRAIARQ